MAAEKSKFSFQTLSKYMYLLSIVVVFAIFTILQPNFISLYSLQNMCAEIAPRLIMACGLTFVIFTGGIDLGAGYMVSATCVLTGLYLPKVGNWIILFVAVAGLCMGTLNGIITTKLKLPSFIVTLCTQNFWNYIALSLCPDGSVIVPMTMREVTSWMTAPILGIPATFWLSLVGLGALYVFQQYTKNGRSIYSVGANAQAARVAGVNIDAAQISAFAVSGLCCGIAGIMFAYKLRAANPTVGSTLQLSSLAAVALGGTAMAGGFGSVTRTLCGVITITAVTSGLNILSVNPLWQNIIIGIILIVAVILNSDNGDRNLIIK